VDARVSLRRPAPVGAETMENMRVHWPIGQQMLIDNPLQQRVIHMVIPGPVRVDDQDRAPSAHPQTVTQCTLHPLRVPEPGQPVGLRQGSEASCQALRGLWGGAVAVFTDQDLAPVGPHAWGARLLCPARFPSLDGLAGASWHRPRAPPRGSGHGEYSPPDDAPGPPTGWILTLLPHLRVGLGGESGLRTPRPNPWGSDLECGEG